MSCNKNFLRFYLFIFMIYIYVAHKRIDGGIVTDVLKADCGKFGT